MARVDSSLPFFVCCAVLLHLSTSTSTTVFCIMMRYSLIVGEVCRPAFASFWGVAFPWLVGWLLYQGHSAQALINYTGNIVNAFVNYVAPLILAMKAVGIAYDRNFFSVACSPLRRVRTTIVAPLPERLRVWQGACTLILLAVLIPLIVVSLVLATLAII